MRIPLIKPYIDDEVVTAVEGVLRSGFLTEGEVTAKFERKCAEFLSVSETIAVTSCTVGLEMAMRCLGIGPGDEVIVPDYTYPATAAAAANVGAAVVVVDIDPRTMLMDYGAAADAVTERTKAVVPVSLFGNPVDYRALSPFRERGIPVVEDAACALGAGIDGARVGGRADITVFSLHPRKFITTGEGGLITTRKPEWAGWLRARRPVRCARP